MITVVAVDIDGTLITVDGALPHKNKIALREARRRDILLVLATARSVAGAVEILTELAIPGAIIAELGATVIDADGSVVAARRFSAHDAAGIANALTQESLQFICTAGEVNYESSSLITARTGIGRKLESSAMDYSQVSRIVVRGASRRRVRSALQGHSVDLYVGAVAPGGARDVILVPNGVSKGAGLAALCRHRGIDRTNVLAIGDSSTDASLLDWAGRGVVVADGDPALRARASWIAPSAADGGVADTLLHFSVVGSLPTER